MDRQRLIVVSNRQPYNIDGRAINLFVCGLMEG